MTISSNLYVLVHTNVIKLLEKFYCYVALILDIKNVQSFAKNIGKIAQEKKKPEPLAKH